MILVLFGTNPYPFERLAVAIEHLAKSYEGEIYAQTGNTPRDIDGVTCQSFMDHTELLELMAKADIVITQGGFGSITDSLRLHKPVVAVPRREDLGECADGGMGQTEIVREFELSDLLIAVYNIEDLEDAVKRCASFEPRSVEFSRIPQLIQEDISKWLKL